MERFWRDLRFGLRTLTKAPAFTAAAVLSLALGIGVNTTIFTVINTLFLNPLPVDHASELLAVYTADAANPSPLTNLMQVSYPNYKDLRDANTVFSGLAAYSFATPVSLATGGDPDQDFVELATGNYFSTLGVRPAAGRLFGPDDDKAPGASPIMVISHALWQRRFGGERDVVGRVITLNGTAFTVVGVAPDGFHGVNAIFGPDGWVPMAMYREVLPSQLQPWIDERRALVLNLAGRLKPGVTIEQARANLVAIARSLETTYPAPNQGRSVAVRPLTEATIFPGARQALLVGGAVMMVIVGLVLLIACSNVANLLLSRATVRGQEIAVRLALGASRPLLVRQLMTESLLLGAIGGALGLLVAVWSLRLIQASRPPVVAQNFVELRLDGVVLLFTFVVSMLTSLVFGLAPALQASGASVVTALKDNTRGAGRRRDLFSLANILIIGQVALSLVALITAALFMRSSQAATAIDPGFDTTHTLVATLSPGQVGYDEGRGEQFYRTLKERLQAAPGVQSVSYSTNMPLFGGVQRSVFVEGRIQPQSAPVLVMATAVDTQFFDTAGIGLLRGRDFTPEDRAGALPVAIVNDAMARQCWPGQEALGKRFRYYMDATPREVVGVAKTAKFTTLGEPPQPAAYTPLAQGYSDTVILYLRAKGDPALLMEPVRRELRQLDPKMPIQNTQTMKDLVGESLWPVRLGASLLAVFGVLALGLACVGLYGVMSYSVNQRTREIGLRMALGASRTMVMGLVLEQGLTLVGIGVLLGLFGTFSLSKYIASILYGSAVDPVSFIGASTALIVVAALASLIPAFRASRVDPIVALREG